MVLVAVTVVRWPVLLSHYSHLLEPLSLSGTVATLWAGQSPSVDDIIEGGNYITLRTSYRNGPTVL